MERVKTDILSEFRCFEQEMKHNKYVQVERCPGKHCICLFNTEDNLVVEYIKRDFQANLYPNFTFKDLKPGLEVCLLDYSTILSDNIEKHLPPKEP
jgi:hypothetical protein